MSKQSYQILNYIKEHGPCTAKEISDALNIEKRRVDSYFSAAIVRAGLGERDQSVTPSILRLTEEGMKYEEVEFN